jgi:Na+-transporting NADH:ubiquinone oxidoreductase subunit C
VQRSALFTVVFAAAVCGVCSVFVAVASVGLRGRQEENRLLDRRTKVLDVAGLLEPGERLSRDEINQRFSRYIQPRVIHLARGEDADDVDPLAFDPRREARDPETSRPAAENAARVRRLPRRALVYHVVREGQVTEVILPIEGMGLWSTLYGYLALAADTRSIRGITFYEHAETPGLGGEVDNPRWKALWRDRKAFDEQWRPRIAVIKGRAGPPDQDPYRVDGLSGATLTARGVTHLVQFWLGEDGFGPYLRRFRSGEGAG